MSFITKVILVTGGNKGIGYAIVRNLALSYANLSSSQPLKILLTARNPTLGQNSTYQLHEELKPKNVLTDDGGNVDLKFLSLDITDEQSIKDVKKVIEKDYGGLDVLINNAAIAFKGDAFDVNVVRITFATNFYGTLNLINHFYPLIRPNGRIVNVSSSVGRLYIVSKALGQEFSKQDLDMDGLIELMKRFEDAVEKDTYEQEGWPRQAYAVSKLGLMTMTKILARRADSEGNNIKVFSCCPGWVKTDMAGERAPLTPDQGAKIPVLLALDENIVIQNPNGSFLKEKKNSAL
ncbi:carbonyl reductase NADPH 1-like [Gigaspora margarita]|uniref:Carbonyl reductase NADPH 1-like n=1 Tax=Gigaspora margarita TaxID=4874 RepID=A0A8H4EIH5_GIGMA|nr:carbonyl reductase NADPH 1-like [Gigaspora margarita]